MYNRISIKAHIYMYIHSVNWVGLNGIAREYLYNRKLDLF